MNSRTKNRSGMVAIMVTTMIMIILTLITIGFARIVSRNQRQALDNQLSTQAFYAAESGVNAVSARLRAGATLAEKNDCSVTNFNNGVIDSATPEVRFTCLKFDPDPSTLEYNNGAIKAERAKVVPIFTSPRADTLTFSWSDNDPNRTEPGADCDATRLPSVSQWPDNRVSALQVDLIPFPVGTGNLNREFLDQNTATFIFYPCDNGGASVTSVSYANFRAGDTSGARRGTAQAVFCSRTGGYTCSVSVTGFPAMDYYARIKSVYTSANVKVDGRAAGVSVAFANAQVLVDSTGKANDVLRRIQVRLPFNPQPIRPEASIQTQEPICKLYTVIGPAVNSDCD